MIYGVVVCCFQTGGMTKSAIGPCCDVRLDSMIFSINMCNRHPVTGCLVH